ncbi:aminotransferase class I/II-fold pyridoxal phosphate-dependent enzyme [Streptomyces sp. NPDC004096]
MTDTFHQYTNIKKLYSLSNSYWDYAAEAGVHGCVFEPSGGGRLQTPDGRSVVNMSSYSYLGLDEHPQIVAAAVAAVQGVGVLNSSLSRVRMTLPILEEAESALSALFDAEVGTVNSCAAGAWATLPVLSSGLLTGGIPPVLVFDKRAHFCLAALKAVCADETRVVTIPHNDMEALERICRENRAVAYVCDSVYSTGGTVAPVAELVRLQEKYGLFLYFDEAHSTSVVGTNGRGFALDIMGSINERTMLITSLNKGFGGSGGAIMFGPRGGLSVRRAVQRNSGPLMWSQRINTAGLGAIVESVKLHRSAELVRLQEQLQANIRYFDEVVESVGHGNTVPIRYIALHSEHETVNVSRCLLEAGYYVEPDFFPIVKRGGAGLRVRLRSTMSRDDIDGFGKALDGVLKDRPENRAAAVHSGF